MKDNLNALVADPDVRVLIENSIETRSLFISYPKEINVSNFLAWLFNPREGHGLGDRAVKELMNQARKLFDEENINLDNRSKTAITVSKWDSTKIFNATFSNIVIQRELKVGEGNNAIDLAIFDMTNKLAIFVELKLGASEGENQTNGYYDSIRKNLLSKAPFKDYDAIFIFLDSRDTECKDTKWIPLGFEWLTDFLKRQKNSPIIHENNSRILSEYADLLDDENQMKKLELSHRDLIDRVAVVHKDILKHFNNNFRNSNYSEYLRSDTETQLELAQMYYQSKKLWDFVWDYSKFTPFIIPVKERFPYLVTETKQKNIYYNLTEWTEFYSDDYPLWGIQVWLKRLNDNPSQFSLQTCFHVNGFKPQYAKEIREIAKKLKPDAKFKENTNLLQMKSIEINENDVKKITQHVITRLSAINESLSKLD